MKLFHVYRDTHRALYCGPVAICAVTGASASRVLAIIEKSRGASAFTSSGRPKGVRGMAHGDVESALATLGFTGTFEDVERKTLARYLWDLRDSGDDRFRIVNIPGHYVAIGGRGEEACDSFSKQPVPPEKIKHRRAHVLYELIINEGVKT